jgi:murein L,D-transpeptidase YafK
MIRLLLSVILLSPLANAESGEELQPAYFLQLPASVADVFVAETDAAELHHFKSVAGELTAVGVYYMSIGQYGVGKQRPWDRRTPLGIYFLNDELDTSKLHPRYGVKAFPLDYPNSWDHLKERSGDGIWLHGVDPDGGKRPPLDTDGCLALPNEDLLRIAPHIVPLKTPVIVTRKLQQMTVAELRKTRDELKAALDQWAVHYRDADMLAYFELYAEEFTYRGLSRDEWMAYRLQTTATRTLDELRIDELYILADPEEPGLYLSRFTQTLLEGDGRVTTTKRLYWKRLDGRFQIVAEDNG